VNHHHPELPADIEAQLTEAYEVWIPLPDCDPVRDLDHWFEREWIDFLWHYRRHSPLLFQFIMNGKYAGWYYHPKYLRKKVARLQEWIDDAKKDFHEDLKFFLNSSLDTSAKARKHWRNPKVPPSKVRQESLSRREGIFHPRFKDVHLHLALFVAMNKFFRRFKNRSLRFVSVDFGEPVGFAYGNETSHVRYDLDYTSNRYHAYPVTIAEARKHPRVTLREAGYSFSLG
jgi:hypothetical protein